MGEIGESPAKGDVAYGAARLRRSGLRWLRQAGVAVAKALLPHGYGGMVAFEVAGGGRPEVFRFLEKVKLARAAPTLGDVATLVMHPASAAARRMTPEERAAAGISENLVRVSVGLEDAEDIAEDILQAVAAARTKP